jgi:hypothetical protein
MLCYNNIVIKRHVLKYVSLDRTGSLINVRMDHHFVDMSTQVSVFRNLNFVAAG